MEIYWQESVGTLKFERLKAWNFHLHLLKYRGEWVGDTIITGRRLFDRLTGKGFVFEIIEKND